MADLIESLQRVDKLVEAAEKVGVLRVTMDTLIAYLSKTFGTADEKVLAERCVNIFSQPEYLNLVAMAGEEQYKLLCYAAAYFKAYNGHSLAEFIAIQG